MTDLPAEAVDAAARWLHDEECNDGETDTCGRWICGSDPQNQFHSPHARHVEFYRERASAVLYAAFDAAPVAFIERDDAPHMLTEGEIRDLEARYPADTTSGTKRKD